ncbi:serine hydrolase domain-containing protein [Adhaeribacter radiodurans]|uniref:Beta-lactamase family protein n=1 Tax=Adhaeribacter radiodurans TaxID=2745197 RepID=A0A7L7L5N7_9BACT|nr:serine hydrolase domain-containing protein [Adhaeribacter radiodurans]QMU28131.1 beta-lactamase family protein [Adhaeribacter radiodurans]
MKRLLLILVSVASLCACQKDDMEMVTNEGTTYTPGPHPKADSLQKMLKRYTSKGIPGAIIAIKDANGLWLGAAGYAKLEDKIKMTPTMLQYGFSITKSVTAVAIMQLKESGKIDLDRPIKDYLPANLHSLVPKTNQVTVRMLLNQTSGYNDYVRTNEFTMRWMDDPLKVWTRGEYYDLIKRKTTNLFTPGTDFQYSNTNYYLLSIIIDTVTGRPHSEWFQQHIFNKLNLSTMFYKQAAGYPFYSNLPNTYWPRFDNGKIENNSKAQSAWMQSEEFGATGIIASPEDYIRFLEGLLNGKLVSEASLLEMKQWVQGKASVEPDYGLGLTYFGYRGKPNFGHDGDGIGANAFLLYFPTSQTYMFIASNSSTEFGGPMQQNISNFRNEVGNFLAGF